MTYKGAENREIGDKIQPRGVKNKSALNELGNLTITNIFKNEKDIIFKCNDSESYHCKKANTSVFYKGTALSFDNILPDIMNCDTIEINVSN